MDDVAETSPGNHAVDRLERCNISAVIAKPKSIGSFTPDVEAFTLLLCCVDAPRVVLRLVSMHYMAGKRRRVFKGFFVRRPYTKVRPKSTRETYLAQLYFIFKK